MRTREKNKDYMNKYRFQKKVAKIKEAHTVCQVCFDKVAQTLHHRNEDHGDNRNVNLLPVCQECHTEIPHQSDKFPKTDSQTPQKQPPEPQNEVLQPIEDVEETYYLGQVVTLVHKSKPYIKLRCEVRPDTIRMLKKMGYQKSPPRIRGKSQKTHRLPAANPLRTRTYGRNRVVQRKLRTHRTIRLIQSRNVIGRKR